MLLFQQRWHVEQLSDMGFSTCFHDDIEFQRRRRVVAMSGVLHRTLGMENPRARVGLLRGIGNTVIIVITNVIIITIMMIIRNPGSGQVSTGTLPHI